MLYIVAIGSVIGACVALKILTDFDHKHEHLEPGLVSRTAFKAIGIFLCMPAIAFGIAVFWGAS